MVNVQRREDGLLDEMRALYVARDLTLLQLRLHAYAYPELQSVWDDLRACLEGADSE